MIRIHNVSLCQCQFQSRSTALPETLIGFSAQFAIWESFTVPSLALSETIKQLQRIICCCLLCPCIRDKVRQFNTAYSKGCLWSMQAFSSPASSPTLELEVEAQYKCLVFVRPDGSARLHVVNMCIWWGISLHDNTQRMLRRWQGEIRWAVCTTQLESSHWFLLGLIFLLQSQGHFMKW